MLFRNAPDVWRSDRRPSPTPAEQHVLGVRIQRNREMRRIDDHHIGGRHLVHHPSPRDRLLNLRILCLVSGRPSLSFASSRSSCRVMRNARLNWKSCSGTSTAATRASDAHSQTNATLINPAPRPSRSSPTCGPGEDLREQRRHDPRGDAPDHPALQQRLAEFGGAAQPNKRLNPLRGLMRVKSGVRAAGLNSNPDCDSGENHDRDERAENRQQRRHASIDASRSAVEHRLRVIQLMRVYGHEAPHELRHLGGGSELVAASATLPPIMARTS